MDVGTSVLEGLLLSRALLERKSPAAPPRNAPGLQLVELLHALRSLIVRFEGLSYGTDKRGQPTRKRGFASAGGGGAGPVITLGALRNSRLASALLEVCRNRAGEVSDGCTEELAIQVRVAPPPSPVLTP